MEAPQRHFTGTPTDTHSVKPGVGQVSSHFFRLEFKHSRDYYYTNNYKARTRIHIVYSLSDVFSTIETIKLSDALFRIDLNTILAFHLVS